MKGKSVLLLKFCSTVRTVTLYLFHVLRANYCKKGCIDFIIDHIEFLQQLSKTVHQMFSVSISEHLKSSNLQIPQLFSAPAPVFLAAEKIVTSFLSSAADDDIRWGLILWPP